MRAAPVRNTVLAEWLYHCCEVFNLDGMIVHTNNCNIYPRCVDVWIKRTHILRRHRGLHLWKRVAYQSPTRSSLSSQQHGSPT